MERKTDFAFGLLTYDTNNLGDFMQSLAARQFLPQVDCYLNREQLHKVRSKKPIKLIMNGWFLHNPHHWPPSPAIRPLFVSFHITPSAVPQLTGPISIEYFKRHEPIGCRDYFTLRLLKRHGIEAYFSGCLTLTFPEAAGGRSGKILIVDLIPSALESCPEWIKKTAYYYSHYFYPPVDVKIYTFFDTHFKWLYKIIKKLRITRLARFSIKLLHRPLAPEEGLLLAQQMLDEYKTARLVLTSRLHCALPCLAVGTPVVFVPPKSNSERLEGYQEYLNSYTPEMLCSLDFEKISSNVGKISMLKSQLIKVCQNFVDSDE